MSGQRLSIRIPDGLQGNLTMLAQATGRSESELAREALEEYCRERVNGPSCYELAEKAGLIGCARRLPKDLSTNPRNLEGFGRD